MNATIRGLKGLFALGALAGLGLLLRWVTAGSIGAATAQDLTAMASLAVGAVAWVAYCWLVIAVLATVLEQAPGVVGRGASVVAARITSQGSRALLRSALGVAAVTPLTIGVAQASPGDSPHTFTTTTTHPGTAAFSTAPSGSRPWTSVEPRSTIQLTGSSQPARSVQPRPGVPQMGDTSSGSRPWSSTEPRSSVELIGETPIGPRASSPVEARSAVPRTSTGSRPSSSVEPRSTADATGDWRVTEAPSSIRLTEQGSIRLTEQGSSARTEAGRVVAPRTRPSTGKAAQRTQPTTRTTAAAGKPASTGRTAIPEKSPVGQVAVPDRPTTGAATRYTDLQSGQLARPAPRVVKPGESLWSIAAIELGPTATDEAIAARWPHWYAANRQLIGPNPNLIQPGQVLNPPAPSHPVPPTHQEK